MSLIRRHSRRMLLIVTIGWIVSLAVCRTSTPPLPPDDGRGLDLLANFDRRAFIASESFLAWCLVPAHNRDVVTIRLARFDEEFPGIAVRQGETYTVIVRLYPSGLAGLRDHRLDLQLDSKEVTAFSLAQESQFLVHSSTFVWTSPSVDSANMRFSLEKRTGSPHDNDDRTMYVVSHDCYHRGIALTDSLDYSSPATVTGNSVLCLVYNPALPDARGAMGLVRKRELMLRSSPEGASLSMLHALDLASPRRVNHAGRTLTVTFTGRQGTQVLLSTPLKFANSWVRQEIDCRSLAGLDGVFSVRLSDQRNDKQADETVFAIGTFTLSRREQSGGDKPVQDLVLISLDTVRASSLGCYGHPEVQTPALDALARQSFVFTEAYSQLNLTLPSHVSLMTSQPAIEHGIFNNLDRVPRSLTGIEHVCAADGFQTVGVVSTFHLNSWVTGFGSGLQTFYHCPDYQRVASASVDLVDRYMTTFFNRYEPLFLFVHLMDAHTLYQPPTPFDRIFYEGDPRRGPGLPILERNPSPFQQNEQVRFADWLKDIRDPDYPLRLYLGEISAMDRSLGKLFSLLKQRQRWQRCLLVLTADHGESLGEHDVFYNHRGPWLPNYHIPLLMKIPGQSSKMIEQKITHIDIAPTLIEMLDRGIPSTMSGTPLLKRVGKGIESNSPRQDPVILETERNAAVTVLWKNWKMIVPLREDEAYPGKDELYNIDTDPGETIDVIEANPEVARRMRHGVSDWLRKDMDDSAATPRENIDDELRKKLAILGYVEH